MPLLAVTAHAVTDPTAKCQALKLQAAGVKTLSKAKCYQKGLLKGLPVDPECLAKVETKFATSVAKADSFGPCMGLASALGNAVDACLTSYLGIATCPPGDTDCSGACFNLASDETNCGACRNFCEVGEFCANGTCHQSPMTVLVTSTTYDGNLGGLAGADAKCQQRATAAGLLGTYKAFLSDSGVSAAARLTHASVPYVLVDGTFIANDATQFFSSSHLSPIDKTETGAVETNGEVWTGSGGSGVGFGGCSDWTSADPGGSFPAVGSTSRADAGWATVFLQFCDRLGLHLYCVEQ